MGKFIGLVLVALCLAAGIDLSGKAQVPAAVNCSGYTEATMTQQILLKAWVFSSSWTVHDIFVVRVAKTGHPEKTSKEDFILIQLPFTNGTWYRV